MTDKVNDPEWLDNFAGKLRKAAQDLDETIETLPETLEAGPFNEPLLDMVESVAANTSALVLRVEDAAINCYRASGKYSESELDSLRIVEDVGKAESGRGPLLPGAPGPHVPIWEQGGEPSAPPRRKPDSGPN